MAGMEPVIVELRVRNMEHSMLAAISEYEVERDAMIHEAVRKALSEENVQRVIEREVEKVVETVIRQEVESFYRNGAGRTIIAERVRKALL